MYCNRRGTEKNQPGQKPPRTIEIEFVQGTFVRDFCTRPTKNRGSEICDVLSEGSRDVWQSVTGGGGQNWPNIAWRTLWTAPFHAISATSFAKNQFPFKVWLNPTIKKAYRSISDTHTNHSEARMPVYSWHKFGWDIWAWSYLTPSPVPIWQFKSWTHNSKILMLG